MAPDEEHVGRAQPGQVTRLVERSRRGERAATEELLPLVYDKLRSLAAHFMSREVPGHTLQATALVHEAYLRLTRGSPDSWENRAHFFGAAANSVRRILVEHARSKRRRQRLQPQDGCDPTDVAEITTDRPANHILAVDAALEQLHEINQQQACMVEMRFFGGMNTAEIAEALAISPRTIARDWVLAKAWLSRELRRVGLDD